MTRLKQRSKIWSWVACAALLAGAASESGVTAKPLTENAMIQAMHVAATNQRARHGLFEQQLDESLCQTAQAWANNMANRNVMYHGGGEQVVAHGYPTPAACIQGWINSPGHRVWVLGRNGRCGFGVQRSWSGRYYYAGVYR
ncbi:Cysteine-rich secretory protein family protein [Thalassoglobus neptunius]|uniref:Cysteine-rich secretory protein family protein n=1 Tax=Thalassoglobus neptunius TaxID=1938619 RepID=A0A5C5X492_9PLAN|nr:CAP domain-containing protein [Thalassoglobus neptunius]TWT57399.1 Cysteine-rich secretory protein family protein [Thalassoglobus neptunius]